uniref:Uncharacterized protein n=1 Tax=Rhizophora mucronata TaxID=61149 RepID=A0A2P2N9H1_RHIMU
MYAEELVIIGTPAFESISGFMTEAVIQVFVDGCPFCRCHALE